MSDWKSQVDEYLALGYHIAHTDLIQKYKKAILDQCGQYGILMLGIRLPDFSKHS